jgi:hypothetical protein
MHWYVPARCPRRFLRGGGGGADADTLVALREAPEATDGTLAEAAAAAERFREAVVGMGASGVSVIFLFGLLGAGLDMRSGLGR